MQRSVLPGLWLTAAVTLSAPLDPGAGVLALPVVEHVTEVDASAGRPRRSHGDMTVVSLFPLNAAGLASALIMSFLAQLGPRCR